MKTWGQADICDCLCHFLNSFVHDLRLCFDLSEISPAFILRICCRALVVLRIFNALAIQSMFTVVRLQTSSAKAALTGSLPGRFSSSPQIQFVCCVPWEGTFQTMKILSLVTNVSLTPSSLPKCTLDKVDIFVSNCHPLAMSTATLATKRIYTFRSISGLAAPQRTAATEIAPSIRKFLGKFGEIEATQIVVAALEEELDKRPAQRSAMAAALARGALAREQLKNEEGGSLSAEEARQVLGLSKESVLKRYRSGALLGWREAKQDAVRFPAWQFSDATQNRLLPGLQEVLKILKEGDSLDDWGRVLFFLNPRERLKGQRPLDLLRGRRVSEVKVLAGILIE